jgi:hypothetical protein
VIDEFAPGGVPVVVRLSDVVPEPVEWLWPGRIPRGKLTLLIGDPGLGKSFLTLDIAARLSRSATWPDGGHAPAGDSVLLSAEDGLADTIRPRLDQLAADVTHIHALTAMREAGVERSFNLEIDLDRLGTVIEMTKATLVGIDPLSAYLGDRDSYKDSEIRGLLGPLVSLAERTRAAVIGIVHLTKDQQRQALYRALGSIAFVAAARVVMAVGKDPEDEERRFLVPIKNNLAAPLATLAFTLKRGVLDWYPGPIAGVHADTILGQQGSSQEEREEGHDAERFLQEQLADGDVKARDGEAGARASGIAPRTLDRARRRLGVRAYSVGYRPKTWWWSLSKDAKDAKGATFTTTPQGVASYEQGGKKKAESTGASPKTATSQGAVGDVASYETPRRSALPPKSWP